MIRFGCSDLMNNCTAAAKQMGRRLAVFGTREDPNGLKNPTHVHNGVFVCLSSGTGDCDFTASANGPERGVATCEPFATLSKSELGCGGGGHAVSGSRVPSRKPAHPKSALEQDVFFRRPSASLFNCASHFSFHFHAWKFQKFASFFLRFPPTVGGEAPPPY